MKGSVCTTHTQPQHNLRRNSIDEAPVQSSCGAARRLVARLDASGCLIASMPMQARADGVIGQQPQSPGDSAPFASRDEPRLEVVEIGFDCRFHVPGGSQVGPDRNSMPQLLMVGRRMHVPCMQRARCGTSRQERFARRLRMLCPTPWLSAPVPLHAAAAGAAGGQAAGAAVPGASQP